MADIVPEPTTEPNPLPPTEPTQLSRPLPPLPWWALGLVVGVVAALIALMVSVIEVSRDPTPHGAYRATARVLVPPARGETAVPDAERQRIAFLVRDRDLLARVLAAPEVAELRTVSAFRDPAPELARRLAVEVTRTGVVDVALVGDDPHDLAALLDRLVARFVEEHAALARKVRNERVSRLDQVAAALRSEIEARENAIKVVNRANGTSDPSPLLSDRLNRLETELAKGAPELALLERRTEALKKRRTVAPPPDPVAAAQLVDADPRVAPLLAQRADAAIALAKETVAAPASARVKDLQAKLDRAEKALAAARAPVRKEMGALLREADDRHTGRELEEAELRLASTKTAHEALRRESDAVRKALAATHAPGASTDEMRRSLLPFQEQADKITAQLAQLRADEPTAEERARVAGPALVGPNPGPWRWGAPSGAALRAFAIAFVLVVAFQLTGLVFHALRSAGARA